ncbi:hypothetical protein VHEMI04750 [[Torrubiella] hemipterigena]|uniref:Major facilitator superfamily (MFS) profile domain-containing protein n=1 Tax=[Torrubiella] hemipterigena TaxID=1531966 RepID=A0A0A1TF81_9HYPO|nr:hypothetical protein VHEMI04750 [[Torrubiella] hemipterigena]
MGAAAEGDRDSGGDLGHGETEKAQNHQHKHTHAQTSQRLDSNSPITEVYLSFDTDLPHPASWQQATPSDASLPKCPNLRAYTNPNRWSKSRKNVLLFLSCLATLLTAYTSGAYSPPMKSMAHDFHTSRLVVVSGLTSFTVGFGIMPMALAPLSEAWGRYPIIIPAGLVFVVFQAVCSVLNNVAAMIVCRFIVGASSSVFSVLLGGVIADLWDKEDRNTPMALFSGAVLFGSGLGPLIASSICELIPDRTLFWKWTFWHQVILDGALLIALILFFAETRASVLLSKKARILNQWYEAMEQAGVYGVWVRQSDLDHNAKTPAISSPAVEQTATGGGSGGSSSDTLRTSTTAHKLERIRWVVKADELRPPLATLVSTSVKRPFSMLFMEPIVFCFSLWASFAWGILYLAFGFVPFLYADDYNMSSRVYLALMASSLLATAAGVFSERALSHPQWKPAGSYNDSKFWAYMRRRFPADAPEARLYFALVFTLFLPAGLFLAFTVPESWQQYAQAIGLGIANWGIYSVYLATFNYLADSYHIYASSALAAQSLARNLMGGIFPIIAAPLFGNLGLYNAGYILGSVATLLTVTPWVLVFFGSRIRANSKLAVSLQK